MIEPDFEQVKALISEQVDNPDTSEVPENEFLEMIATRVEFLMESNMELFINHLYRMDVDEHKVNNILLMAEDSDESVYQLFAKLIYTRQKERLETKKKFSQGSVDFWAEE